MTSDITKINVRYAVLINCFAFVWSDFAIASLSLFFSPVPRPKSKYPIHIKIELIVNQIPYSDTGNKERDTGNVTRLKRTVPNWNNEVKAIFCANILFLILPKFKRLKSFDLIFAILLNEIFCTVKILESSFNIFRIHIPPFDFK